MDIGFELIIIVKLLVSFILGGLIGYDRELHGSDAGIRTYAAVCIGSTLFTAIACHLTGDPGAASRVIANIVTGIGFLGAGIIYRNNTAGSSHGLTTAATVWCTAAVGVAVGLDMYIIALAGALTLYFLLSLHHRKWYIHWMKKMVKGAGDHSDAD
ncbi:MgtC/SapB family protein [Sediminibacterium sp.]|uniref:MgtC/SapB family protein n=1 Tax=Sediminibacterium sp. TaxID=1917865 RepID=UPI002731B84D|nr:MgtC/SapB family protein [Sediminibacterium sp.]MDP2421413.1 MgtC/SapB family protein [Sediminibacterium sp.]